MAADIVPIGLALDDRDVFTLWAPRWRDAGDEWEAFLGKDEHLYVFGSVADLAAFVRVSRDNDLTDHPAWSTLTSASAHKLDPEDGNRFDLIKVYELLAEKPSAESVAELANTLAIASAIGTVCELTAVTKFFNGNPVLSSVSGGLENFADKVGSRRWQHIGTVVDRGWDKVLDAIDEVVATPDVDSRAAAKAGEELRTAAEEAEVGDVGDVDDVGGGGAQSGDEFDAADEQDAADDTTASAAAATTAGPAAAPASGSAAHDIVLGGDENFWHKVGIDPVRMITSRGTFYTLRCYLDDAPVFLGRNGRISVFPSERSLARYLADEHDHDLSDLATYDDIRTAATDGSLRVEVTDDNVYVLTGLADDLTDGPEEVDREQLDLAVELLRDVGEYAEDEIVAKTLDGSRPLGKLVGHVLNPADAAKPKPPYASAIEEWTRLESFLESRLRPE